MSAKLCRICGAAPVPGARFCRVCGTPLQTSTGADTGNAVSPLAQTIPLAGEGRPTDGIAPEDFGFSKPETGKVGQDEFERLVRRPQNGGESQPQLDAGVLSRSNAPTVVMETEQAGDGANTVSPSSAGAGQPPVAPAPAVARPRRTWQFIAIGLLCIALVAGALAIFYSRQPSSSEVGGSTPISISDQKKLVDEQLAEADALLATGDIDGAIAKLRYAVKIDPSNSEAHRRLGHALEKKGERSEAIDEYQAATRSDASNTAAWRALAAAQFNDGRYSDSAESYTQLINAMDEREVDDNLRLEYADALQKAGRIEDARAQYQRVTDSESLDLARRASEQLKLLPPPVGDENTNNANNARDHRAEDLAAQTRTPDANASQAANNTTIVPVQQPAPVAAAPPNNRAPENNNPDKLYFEALNIVQGRDVKTLQRAELLRAMQLFQNVKSGPHSSDAKKQEKRLGKEYDRRRKND
ncbi:MAG: tetratricopeptide repeat protein [Pyrinomonadaceae bacterium]|nr:tetratricopeptide repeat protein [Pyrinomonadaceae bacterium]